jgi:hypothetical protein
MTLAMQAVQGLYAGNNQSRLSHRCRGKGEGEAAITHRCQVLWRGDRRTVRDARSLAGGEEYSLSKPGPTPVYEICRPERQNLVSLITESVESEVGPSVPGLLFGGACVHGQQCK